MARLQLLGIGRVSPSACAVCRFKGLRLRVSALADDWLD